MKHSHLLSLMKEAGLSPEQMADRLGVSGMTLRRWERLEGDAELPKLYERGLAVVISELVAEGHLSTDAAVVKMALTENPHYFNAFSPVLGITPDMLKEGGASSRRLMESLSKLGENPSRKEEVDKNKARIFSFKKMSAEWKKRISSLWLVLRSSELHSFDKLVAYGALFYLLMPFDLIPDHIPVIGYMDDYIVLGLAVAYYVKRFPHLFTHD